LALKNPPKKTLPKKLSQKNPPQKTHPKKKNPLKKKTKNPPASGFFCFFLKGHSALSRNLQFFPLKGH
jgi:hypothetical protein